MIDFLCKLWPYLAGGLIGWLLAGWFARKLKHSGPPVEKIVEKTIDNPQHLALISKLENENKEIAGLRTRLSGFESATVKTVDNPEHIKRIKELESQVSDLKSKPAKIQTSTSSTPLAAASSPPKIVDNPDHIKRISLLESQLKASQNGPDIDLSLAKSAGFKLKSENDFTVIEGIGPKINDLIHEDGIKSFSQLSNTSVSLIQSVLDNAGPRYKIANPGTWPDQANLAANNRWSALKALQDVLVGGVYPDAKAKAKSSDNSVKSDTLTSNKSASASKNKSTATKTDNTVKTTSAATTAFTVDKVAAKAAGFRVKVRDGRDDFTVVEGIGPKINDLIHDAGIHTYAELGRTLVENIQKILDDAGSRYSLAKPGTWPAQADMAAANKWEALKAWQDELDGGK